MMPQGCRLPVAELAVREFGSYVRAIWFVHLPCGRVLPELTYEFSSKREADDDVFTPKHGVFRDGHLFVARAQSHVYDDARTAEIGHPYETERLSRIFLTDNRTSLSHYVRGDLHAAAWPYRAGVRGQTDSGGPVGS